MSDIRRGQERIFNDFERMEQQAERLIIRNYQGRLVDLKRILGEFFERYEDGGGLHHQDMVRYGRLQNMAKSIRGMTVQLYAENTKVIASTLSAAYNNSFSGTGQAISRAWGNHSLIGIIREDEINAAINSDISGLKWAERMNMRRGQATAKIRETIVRGLHEGETYSQMAARLNEAMGQDVPNALRIVRTESYRVFSTAKKDRLDRVQGIDMVKRWLTAEDEAVRANHKPMHNVRVAYHQNFVLPNGNEGFAPGMIGAAEDDINCRCTWVVEMADGDSASQRISANGVDFDGGDGIIRAGDGEMEILPRHDEAVIPVNKFMKHCLDPEGDYDKAVAFDLALGYNKSNANRLIANIRHNLPNFPAMPKGDAGFGMKYEVVMNLTGPNGKTAKVLTAWIDDSKSKEMRLTNAYIDRDRRRGGK
jgi:hypothetical protein